MNLCGVWLNVLAAVAVREAAVAAVRHGRCVESITTANGTDGPMQTCAGQLLFADEFDVFDLSVWNHVVDKSVDYNRQFNWYVNDRKTSYVQDGVLHIRPTVADSGCTPCYNPAVYNSNEVGSNEDCIEKVGGRIDSARIHTHNRFSFKYGVMEVSAKLPAGDWMWPAIWLMPEMNTYGNWPLSGEIDIMESRGNRDLYVSGKNIGTGYWGTTLHYGLDRAHDPWRKSHFESFSDDFTTTFHNYTLIWTPDYFQFILDGKEQGTIRVPEGGFWEFGDLEQSGKPNPWKGRPKIAPFDQGFYIIFNIAVGGTTFFPDGQGEKPWHNSDSNAYEKFWAAREKWQSTWQADLPNGEDASMQIDYVRVYAL